MAQQRRPADPDALITASLHGISSRHASRGTWHEGIAELQAGAGGRTDLLAEVAGVIWGAATVGEQVTRPERERQVLLLLDAGADPERMPSWFQVGVDRARRPWHSI